MTTQWIRSVLCFALFTMTGRALFQDACPALNQSDRAKLATYIQKKYKMPAAVGLTITDTVLTGSNCYRNLEVGSTDPRRPFQIELYASPDFRFLTRELLDTTVDPLEEERRKEAAFVAGLTRGNFPVLGSADAPVTLTVFSDFQCPYCVQMASVLREVMPREAETFRLVFRHFPLPMHPWAQPAAEAAACAQDQGVGFFWQMHDFFFDHQRDLTPDNLQAKIGEYAKGLQRFDTGAFEQCLAQKKTAARVEDDVRFARQNSITGTPTLFINGQRTRISGPEHLRTIIRELSASRSAQTPRMEN